MQYYWYCNYTTTTLQLQFQVRYYKLQQQLPRRYTTTTTATTTTTTTITTTTLPLLLQPELRLLQLLEQIHILQFKQLQFQLRFNYNYNYNHNYNITTSATSTPLQLQLLDYTTLHPGVVSEVTPATIATIPKNTIPTTFRSISGFALPSMHLCHPCITTTHLSYSVVSLKLPPPPCAVLLLICFLFQKNLYFIVFYRIELNFIVFNFLVF